MSFDTAFFQKLHPIKISLLTFPIYFWVPGNVSPPSTSWTHAIQSVLRVTPAIFFNLSNEILFSFDTAFLKKLPQI